MALVPRSGRKSPLDALSASLAARWREMSARERRMVALAAAVVGVALVWLVLLRPALRTQAAAPQRIAELQRQLAQARGEADELARLAAQPPAQARESDLGAAATRWLREQGAQVQAASLPGSVTLQLQHLRASALADFARTARQDWAARISSAKLRLDGDGKDLSGSIALQGPASADSSPAPDGATEPQP